MLISFLNSYRPVIIGFVQYQHLSVQPVLKKWIDTQSKEPHRWQWISTSRVAYLSITNIGEIHYHKENKTNGGKQIEFSAENNQFQKSQKWE